MADRIRKTHANAAEEQTEASVLSAIRYLDSPTDYREYLPGALQESGFVVLDDSRGQAWRRLGDLALIAFLVSMILLLALRT
jgi:hypothetical protein